MLDPLLSITYSSSPLGVSFAFLTGCYFPNTKKFEAITRFLTMEDLMVLYIVEPPKLVQHYVLIHNN